eukprot:Nk52_evm79s210 gene=Nk52_evmTU79s210
MAEKRLLLKAPTDDSDPEVYKWPLNSDNEWDQAVEIFDTIRFICSEFPELDDMFTDDLASTDKTSFEEMNDLCGRYNAAIEKVLRMNSLLGEDSAKKGEDKPLRIDFLHHIAKQSYNRAIDDPNSLNKYKGFSEEVYGEFKFDIICDIIKRIPITKDDIFLDLGSGVGHVVAQVAAQVQCKHCWGIEKMSYPAECAKRLDKDIHKRMKWYGKKIGSYTLLKGDFLEDSFRETIQKSSVIFVNNYAFGPEVNFQLRQRFLDLPEGTKIVSSEPFCPLNFKLSDRTTNEFGAIVELERVPFSGGGVSWTDNPFSYFVHTIARSKLEKYYLNKFSSDNQSSSAAVSSVGSSIADESSSSKAHSRDARVKRKTSSDLSKRQQSSSGRSSPISDTASANATVKKEKSSRSASPAPRSVIPTGKEEFVLPERYEKKARKYVDEELLKSRDMIKGTLLPGFLKNIEGYNVEYFENILKVEKGKFDDALNQVKRLKRDNANLRGECLDKVKRSVQGKDKTSKLVNPELMEAIVRVSRDSPRLVDESLRFLRGGKAEEESINVGSTSTPSSEGSPGEVEAEAMVDKEGKELMKILPFIQVFLSLSNSDVKWSGRDGDIEAFASSLKKKLLSAGITCPVFDDRSSASSSKNSLNSSGRISSSFSDLRSIQKNGMPLKKKVYAKFN